MITVGRLAVMIHDTLESGHGGPSSGAIRGKTTTLPTSAEGTRGVVFTIYSIPTQSAVEMVARGARGRGTFGPLSASAQG